MAKKAIFVDSSEFYREDTSTTDPDIAAKYSPKIKSAQLEPVLPPAPISAVQPSAPDPIIESHLKPWIKILILVFGLIILGLIIVLLTRI